MRKEGSPRHAPRFVPLRLYIHSISHIFRCISALIETLGTTLLSPFIRRVFVVLGSMLTSEDRSLLLVTCAGGVGDLGCDVLRGRKKVSVNGREDGE